MIQSFAYRNPRLAISLPVEFQTGYGLLFGTTHDISDQGLSADFSEPILLNTLGRLRFRVGTCLLEPEATVIHTEGFTVGLAFVLKSERDGLLLRSVLQAVRRAADRTEAPQGRT